jgi:hypothetical protein
MGYPIPNACCIPDFTLSFRKLKAYDSPGGHDPKDGHDPASDYDGGVGGDPAGEGGWRLPV